MPIAKESHEHTDANKAHNAFIAQVFLGLIDPTQASALTPHTAKKNSPASDFQDMPAVLPTTCTGLGRVLTAALFLKSSIQISDIKLTAEQQMIRVHANMDQMTMEIEHPITPKSIEHLPYPFDHNPEQWLDLVKNFEDQIQSTFLPAAQLTHDPKFKQEIYETLINIALLSDKMIDAVVHASLDLVEATSDRDAIHRYCCNFLTTRRDQCLDAASQLPAFVNHLDQPTTASAIKRFEVHVQHFLTNDSSARALNAAMAPNAITQQLSERLHLLQKRCAVERQLAVLVEHKIYPSHVKPGTYLAAARQAIQKGSQDIEKLTKILKKLEEDQHPVNKNPSLAASIHSMIRPASPKSDTTSLKGS